MGPVDKGKEGADLSDVTANEGDDSVDSSVFSGHQTKLLREKVSQFEQDNTVKKNAHINQLLGENTDLYRKLERYEGGGFSQEGFSQQGFCQERPREKKGQVWKRTYGEGKPWRSKTLETENEDSDDRQEQSIGRDCTGLGRIIKNSQTHKDGAWTLSET